MKAGVILFFTQSEVVHAWNICDGDTLFSTEWIRMVGNRCYAERKHGPWSYKWLPD